MLDAALSLDKLGSIDALLSDDERLVQQTVRRLVRERYLQRAGELFASEAFAHDMIPALADLGLLGATLTGYGCAGMGQVAYGLALAELEYGDSGLRSFVSVQGSLAMYAIWRFGSEEQKTRLLPLMARGELIGCFGLTEPDAGSDPAAMKTRAVRDGDTFVLTGTKMWITNAPIAGVAVVWAKVAEERGDIVRGFVVERGSSGLPGLTTPKITNKLSLRASVTGEIVLEACRIPASAMLPAARGLGAPLACLNQARLGIGASVLGAARSSYDAALGYVRERQAFGGPIARKQLVQAELVDMAQEIVKCELLALHLGRQAERGPLEPAQVSLCKRSNVAVALDVARRARALLGANGILLDYAPLRHAMNLESVVTYEGTHEIHTLVLGRALTGVEAF